MKLNKKAQGIITENNLVFFGIIIIAVVVGILILYSVSQMLWIG